MKIDWKRKLSSRKFWLALVGFITPLLIAFGVSENAATEFAALVMSGAACISYIIGEGLVDSGYSYSEPSSPDKNKTDK